ncbi:MAG: hypothetical protein HGA75_12780, partial [Thiobacillus sp.]|nr:hypothetical protein [Thiobacillus sp.]
MQVLTISANSAQVVVIEPYDEHRLRRLPPFEVPLAFVHRCVIAERGRFIDGAGPDLICAVGPDGKFTAEAPDY